MSYHPVTHRLIDGQWTPTPATPTRPERANFVIVCSYGDWSGFRTLAECIVQNPDLNRIRPDGFYWIEER